MKVPQKYHRFLIGKGSAAISKLVADTGVVRVLFPSARAKTQAKGEAKPQPRHQEKPQGKTQENGKPKDIATSAAENAEESKLTKGGKGKSKGGKNQGAGDVASTAANPEKAASAASDTGVC